MRKIEVHCDMCGCNITYDVHQLMNLGRSRYVELCIPCYNKIEDKIINLLEYIKSCEEDNHDSF